MGDFPIQTITSSIQNGKLLRFTESDRSNVPSRLLSMWLQHKGRSVRQGNEDSVLQP